MRCCGSLRWLAPAVGFSLPMLMARTPHAGGPTADDVVASESGPVQIDELVALLASESFITRDWAAAQLVQRGAEAITPLNHAVRKPDARLGREVVHILKRLADDDAVDVAHGAREALQSIAANDGLGNDVREASEQALRESVRQSLARLRAVGATLTRGEDAGLTEVRINSRDFTDKHVALLLRLPDFEHLDLRNSGITNAALEHLGRLTALQHLNLSDTAVNGGGLRQLQPLKELQRLVLYRIPLAADDLRWLRENLPRCTINR